MSKTSVRVAFRFLTADDESLAASLADEVTNALNERLPGPYQLVDRGPAVHERSHGFVSFERVPASAWNKVIEVDGVKSALTGSLLFVLEYDSSLKSKSPGGRARSEWAKGGGDPELEGVEAPFILEVGYFKRKHGMGFSDETRTDVGTGSVLVTDSMENIIVQMDDPVDAAKKVVDLVEDLLAHPPVGSTEPLKGKARTRKSPDQDSVSPA